MNQIKAFHIKAEPTNRGSGNEKLEDIVTNTINAWLSENKDIKNVQVSHSAKTETSYPDAFVIITFERDEKPVESTEKSPSTEAPRRGRPPKN